jgi:branched-chain amino acid transport system ATP-binding protein
MSAGAGSAGAGAGMSVSADGADVLVASQVRKEFGGLVAVNDVDFIVPRGKIVSLIGPNGAGKTTFFNMLTGVYKPTSGVVTFLGEDVTGKPPHAITERGIGRTFQNIRLFQNMTALENVLVGRHARMKANLFNSILRTPFVRNEEKAATERARELLDYTGLGRKRDEVARNLPYGDQRRLEVARALATDPKLLLLDEVMAGLRPTETDRMVAILSALNRESGLTIVLIEHVMRAVMALARRIVVLHHGAAIAEGPPETIVRDPAVIHSYLGAEAIG